MHAGSDTHAGASEVSHKSHPQILFQFVAALRCMAVYTSLRRSGANSHLLIEGCHDPPVFAAGGY